MIIFLKFVINLLFDFNLVFFHHNFSVLVLMSSNHLSSLPVLPNSILYERMFREKPYTKCMDCLANNRLKCRKCMENIIEDMAHKPPPRKVIIDRKISSSPSRSRLDLTMHVPRSPKSPQIKVMVMSKYNWWLSQKQLNKNKENDFREQWPRKTKNYDASLEKFGVKQPRFERWEKKLLDQLLSKSKKVQ